MSQITLPDLPYAKDALEPYISSETIEFQYERQLHEDVNRLHVLLTDSGLENKTLTDVICLSHEQLTQQAMQKETQKEKQQAMKQERQQAIFHHAAQIWNHNFYFHSMIAENGGGEPTGDLHSKIVADFGSYDKCREEFKKAALSVLGSGWAWLTADQVNGKLSIMHTLNADTPMCHQQIAILGCCVWEHAYYLDYRNRRADFVDAFLDHLVNWQYANARYKGVDKDA